MFDDRVTNKQYHRNKNIIPGTAKLGSRSNDPASYGQMGEGRNYKNVWINETGRKPLPKMVINRKTGEKMTPQQRFEKEHFFNFLQENLEVNPKKSIHGSWKPKR